MEGLVLDPAELVGNEELDLHSGATRVREEGVDWGDMELALYLAEGDVGEDPIDYRIPNRKVTIPMEVMDTTTKAFADARLELQAKAAMLQREGGVLKRVLNDGTPVYLDVVGAKVSFGGGSMQARELIDADMSLELETKPDWYGAEEDGGTYTEVTESQIVANLTDIKGDYPARCRIRVTDNSGSPQAGLLWAIRSRFYDSAATAPSWLRGIDITKELGTVSVSLGGNNTVQRTGVGSDWTPVVNTNNDAGTWQTHVGTYRVFARVWTTTPSTTSFRLIWDVGDLTTFEENDPVSTSVASNYAIVDFGTIRLRKPPFGTHRWQGQIQARDTAGNGDLAVARLWLLNVDEYQGRVRAPFVPSLGQQILADQFNQTAGVLSGKSLGATSVTSVKFAGAGSTVAAGGTAWASPGNVTSSNDVRASVTWTAVPGFSTATSDQLRTASHGFAVPVGATIDGIKVEIERFCTGTASPEDLSVMLLKGSPVGSDRSTHAAIPGGESFKSYGGPTDKWGTTWTVAEVNNANFGVAFRAQVYNPYSGVVNNAVFVDSIRITVYYTPSTGDTWSGAGSANDFSVSGGLLTRTAVSDAGPSQSGRFALAGSTTYGAVAVTAYCWRGVPTATSGEIRQGILLRYTDTANFIQVVRRRDLATSTNQIVVYKRTTAGGEVILGQATDPTSEAWPAWLRCVIDSAGRLAVYSMAFGLGWGDPLIVTSHADLTGTLATGKVGLYDAYTNAAALTRWYDAFTVNDLNTSSFDAVAFGNLGVELRTDGVYRDSADGESAGPVAEVIGDLPRLPPAGLEGRTTEVLAKLTRSDLDRLPDTTYDDVTMEISYNPCWLFVGA